MTYASTYYKYYANWNKTKNGKCWIFSVLWSMSHVQIYKEIIYYRRYKGISSGGWQSVYNGYRLFSGDETFLERVVKKILQSEFILCGWPIHFQYINIIDHILYTLLLQKKSTSLKYPFFLDDVLPLITASWILCLSIAVKFISVWSHIVLFYV